jgi:hypothetical protein
MLCAHAERWPARGTSQTRVPAAKLVKLPAESLFTIAYARPALGPDLGPIAKSPFDALQQARLEARLELLRPQLERARSAVRSHAAPARAPDACTVVRSSGCRDRSGCTR